MVCDKCEKKLDKIVTPDAWKDGARNITKGKDGGRSIGGNSMLAKKKSYSYDPLAAKCKNCKCNLNGKSIYCQSCAYAKGICSMCGVKILETKFYKQSKK
mmetsp:Transcript_9089/g.8012  ORF Transcript_9089/g.8012 Transcript_9089/m.8012 type:complete len:100 (+) Transcript_9089:36-335(+)